VTAVLVVSAEELDDPGPGTMLTATMGLDGADRTCSPVVLGETVKV